MNPPSSATPSPSLTNANVSSVASSTRGNPFSIDYILSSSAAAAAAAAVKHHQHQHQKHQNQHQSMHQLPQIQHHQQPMGATASALDQLTLMSQQRAQLMAAAAAVATNSNQLIKVDQTQSPPPQLQQHNANPNFLYFMACMLLNQQQQQQQQQQNHHRQQMQQHQQQQHGALVANQQQQQLIANHSSNRQPIDLARSPMESLNILTRLTGAPTAVATPPTSRTAATTAIPHNHQRHQQEPNSSLGKTLNHHQRLTAESHHQANVRRQPYPLQPPAHHQASALFHHHLHSPPNLGPSPTLHQISNTSSSINNNNNNNNNINILNNSSSQATSITAVNNHGDKLDNLKPAHSYIGLIGMCILSSPEKRMVLNDIYQFILDNYPYYRNRGSGWRNSVRHNLSLNECFQKAGRAANGKGHYWTIHPANMEDFMQGDFRRRRAQRKVRRWNNMDVPSDESEDESMEDATKPPLPEHFKRSLEMHRRLELTYQKTAEATTAAIVAAAAAANQAAATFALNGC